MKNIGLIVVLVLILCENASCDILARITELLLKTKDMFDDMVSYFTNSKDKGKHTTRISDTKNTTVIGDHEVTRFYNNHTNKDNLKHNRKPYLMNKFNRENISNYDHDQMNVENSKNISFRDHNINVHNRNHKHNLINNHHMNSDNPEHMYNYDHNNMNNKNQSYHHHMNMSHMINDNNNKLMINDDHKSDISMTDNDYTFSLQERSVPIGKASNEIMLPKEKREPEVKPVVPIIPYIKDPSAETYEYQRTNE